MNRTVVLLRLALSLFVAVPACIGVAAASAPSKPETIVERIDRRLATIDQKLYEAHRRCYGWQQGIFDLLTRLKEYVAAEDAKTLDALAARYGPDTMFGSNEEFLAEHKERFDAKAGDIAWGKGTLEWGAQRLQPPDKQYDYYISYGFNQTPPECVTAEANLDAIRERVWADEFTRDLYGKDFQPPIERPRTP